MRLKSSLKNVNFQNLCTTHRQHILCEYETRPFRLLAADTKASRAYTPRFCTSTFSLQFYAFSPLPLHSISNFYLQPSAPCFHPRKLPSDILPSAFSHSTFSLQPIYFQSTDLLSVRLISNGLQGNGIYFSFPSANRAIEVTSLGGHTCPPVGHMYSPRLEMSAPWWLKAEGRSSKPRCIRARVLKAMMQALQRITFTCPLPRVKGP